MRYLLRNRMHGYLLSLVQKLNATSFSIGVSFQAVRSSKGKIVLIALQDLPAGQALEQRGAHEVPGHDARAVLGDVPVVLEDVLVLDGPGVEGELDLVGPAVAVLGDDLDEFRVPRKPILCEWSQRVAVPIAARSPASTAPG